MEIQVINASKDFKETLALDDINVDFEKGKIHGIVGRNGSGKTVLMKCICGLMHPTKGQVVVRGKVVGKDIDVPKNVGAIIESPGFLPNYSGFRNLKFLADINKKVSKERIEEVIRLVGLDPKNPKHVSKYSLGMRQRLGIAQAIMENPEILVFDEPMNGLDNDGVLEMRKLFVKLKKNGQTIILASHNKEDIAVLCDRVIEMDHGKILYDKKYVN